MMKAQSLEFISGYLFQSFNKQATKELIYDNTRDHLVFTCNVPKLWFGVANPTRHSTDIKSADKIYVVSKVEETMNDVFLKFNTTVTTDIEQQYIRFTCRMKINPAPVEMTLAEIEEKLGHPVVIRGE